MQPSTSADALNQLSQYQGSLQTPQQAMDAANQQFGVSGAKQTATGLQGAIQNTTNLLNQVAPSVYGRTGNSLVTTAQASKQIDNASAPLQQTLTKQGTDYDNAEKNYEDLVGQSQDFTKNSLDAQNTKLGLLQNIYSDLYTKESDASKLAEQQREYDQSLADQKAARAATASASQGGLSGLSSLTTPSASSTSDPLKTRAASTVNDLLRQNGNIVQTTYNAIKKSASNGNTYDQLKLQLLNTIRPDLAKSK